MRIQIRYLFDPGSGIDNSDPGWISGIRNTDAQREKVSISYGISYADKEKRPVPHVASPDLSGSPADFPDPWRPCIMPKAQK